MIIDELDDAELLERLGKSEGTRTTGVVHLSDIYKIVMKRSQPKRFDKRDVKGNPLPFDKQRIEIGLLFENMLEQALAEKFSTVRPGEIISDEGVYMTPDGVNPTECAGEEYKSTSLSCKDGIYEKVEVGGVVYQIARDKFIHYFIQMKGYAKWLGVTKFLLTVLFIYGDYRFHLVDNCYTEGPCAKGTYCGGGKFRCGPVFKRYRINFTQQEVDENWNMLMLVAREEGLLPS